MQCVILAGGLATRMRPITEHLPKSLIPVAGKPFLFYQLQWLANHGVNEVILCIGYLGEMIEEYAQAGEQWNLRIRYVKEGPQLRGTGGALRLALDEHKLDDRFLVTYGDSFLPVDFRQVWEAFLHQSRPALMTVFKNAGQWDTSNAIYENGHVVYYDKNKSHPLAKNMTYIDYGLCAFRREIIARECGSGEKKDLAQICTELSLRQELAGWESPERFYEIGSPAGLADFTAQIERGAWR